MALEGFWIWWWQLYGHFYCSLCTFS